MRIVLYVDNWLQFSDRKTAKDAKHNVTNFISPEGCPVLPLAQLYLLLLMRIINITIYKAQSLMFPAWFYHLLSVELCMTVLGYRLQGFRFHFCYQGNAGQGSKPVWANHHRWGSFQVVLFIKICITPNGLHSYCVWLSALYVNVTLYGWLVLN